MIKKLIVLGIIFILNIFIQQANYAGNIQYGYNPDGSYAPQSINGQRIQYGYNSDGSYAPQSIGGQRIQYGYNPNGSYAPQSIGY